jgi:threonine dehydrogenase-like Zn-dependent dehydrogenase
VTWETGSAGSNPALSANFNQDIQDMRGIWLEDGDLTLRHDLPVPEPPEGEVLVRVLQAGICNTDIELQRGYYPYRGVLGHEFVGVVESDCEDWAGKRVVGGINASCGQCGTCQSGLKSHCPRRTVLGIVNRDGAFADYLSLPAENLLEVPESVSTDAATFTEPLAAALQIREQVQVSAQNKVLVVGDGKLGLLIAQVLKLTGCRVVAVGRHAGKLDLLPPRGIEVELAGAFDETGFDLAVECTGNEAGFAMARKALRPRGTLVMKSTYAGSLTLDVSSLVVDEITLVGSRCGPFAPALKLLESGAVDVEPLVHDRMPLDSGLEAFERATAAGVLKVLLQVG